MSRLREHRLEVLAIDQSACSCPRERMVGHIKPDLDDICTRDSFASDCSPESRDGRWGLSEVRFVVLRSQVARPSSGQELPTTADF